jgi:hypothetical protein
LGRGAAVYIVSDKAAPTDQREREDLRNFQEQWRVPGKSACTFCDLLP